MPLPQTNQQPNPFVTPQDIPETLGAAAGASFEQAVIDSPVMAVARLSRINAQARRSGGFTGIEPGRTTAEWTARSFLMGRMEEAAADSYEWVTRAQAAEIAAPYGETVESLGISPIGANATVLRTVLEARKEDRERQRVIASGGRGVMGTLVTFSAGVGGSFLDPLNIATSFIPVVGQAKYAQMLKAAGTIGRRTALRVGVGAAEGAVGATLVEPLTVFANEAEGLDYTMMDALMNVMYGAALGSALHSGSGAIADVINKIPFRKKQIAAQHAVVAAVEDRKPMPAQAVEYSSRVNLEDAELRGIEFSGTRSNPIDPWPGRIRIAEATSEAAGDAPINYSEIMSEAPFEELTPQMRDAVQRAAAAPDPEAASKQLLENWADLNDQNVRDMRAMYGKDSPVPLSHAIERKGGLSLEAQIELAKQAGVDLDYINLQRRRPKLYQKKAGKGMSLADVKRFVAEQGYSPTKKIGTKGLAKLLKRDLLSDRVWRQADMGKVNNMRDFADGVKALLSDTERARVQADSINGDDLAKQWDEAYNNEKNAYLYDEQHAIKANQLLEDSRVDAVDVDAELDDLDQIIEAAASRGFDVDEYYAATRRIDAEIDSEVQARQVAAGCVLGGV